MPAKKQSVDMTQGSISGHLIRFAVPMLIGQVFQQLYNTVDSVVVGQFVGKEALAAVGSTGNIINALIGFFSGLSMGAGVIISQSFGARDSRGVHDAVHTSLLLTLLATILVTRSTVRPLKEIAFAARRFTQGDFSARARLPRRQDELYDMTISFNRMAEAMQNTEETRRGLIASVSHDLRTPMTTIAGFVDGILDGTIKPEKQEYYLRIISDEVKRLSRLANSLLTMSRLESGGEERTVFDSSEMIRRIIIGFEQQLKEKKIRLELDLPETLTLKAEHDSFFQAVYNLVDNAVKFTPAGGSITIYLEEKNGKLQFNIVNTGSEIPREMQKHIFDRFYKGDTSRSRNSTGSGLGLYITRTVIQRHGGDIYVRSGEGRTEFCFTVPRNL